MWIMQCLWLDWKAELLPVWYDVDNAVSLARLESELADAPTDVARHTRAFLERHLELLTNNPSSPFRDT
jgi:hypothetical protein